MKGVYIAFMASYTSLYSGSSGNCALIKSGNCALLVDMGKNCKQTCAALAQLGQSPAELSGILITHEHSDHISGLKVFLKKYKIPVYGGAATLDYLAEYDLVPNDACLVAIDGAPEDIDGFSVTAFETSHDSVACRGFHISAPDGRRISVATDLGVVTPQVYEYLKNSDMVALEANYDKIMLMFGAYPHYLKVRIASERGHLCNEETAQTISHLVRDGCKKFALCHLSRENNTPQKALETVTETIAAENGDIKRLFDAGLVISVNKRSEVSDTIEI